MAKLTLRPDELAILMRMRDDGVKWPAIARHLGYCADFLRKACIENGGQNVHNKSVMYSRNLNVRVTDEIYQFVAESGGSEWFREHMQWLMASRRSV